MAGSKSPIPSNIDSANLLANVLANALALTRIAQLIAPTTSPTTAMHADRGASAPGSLELDGAPELAVALEAAHVLPARWLVAAVSENKLRSHSPEVMEVEQRSCTAMSGW